MAGAVACLALVATGCSDDDDPEGEGPPASPSSSDVSSPTDETSPTDEPTTVAPATGPALKVKAVSLRMPEGWAVDNDDASFLVVGAADDGTALINLSSFPALNPDASLDRLARSTVKTGGYPPDSVLPPTTMAGQPAFHVAGEVGGDYSEEFGLIHDGEIVSVEFVLLAWAEDRLGRDGRVGAGHRRAGLIAQEPPSRMYAGLASSPGFGASTCSFDPSTPSR